MGLFKGVKKLIGGVTGATAAEQARGAGAAQAAAIERGYQRYRAALPGARRDISQAARMAGREIRPFVAPGRAAISRMQRMLQQPGLEYDPAEYIPSEAYEPTEYRAPTAEDVAASPAVRFRMQEAQRALERGAAARGGLFGGAHQRELARYMQGLASQEYEQEAERRFRQAQLAEQQAQFGARLGEEQAQFGARFGEEQARFAPELGLRERALRMGGEQFLGQMGFGAGQDIAGIRERLGAARAGLRTGSGAAGASAAQMAGQARASGVLAGQQARQAAMGQLMGLGGAAIGSIGGPIGSALGGKIATSLFG